MTSARESAGEFAGKVVVVTGGSRGLGRAMSLAFAASGATVVVASRKLDNCETVAHEISVAGGQALAFGFHAGRWADAEALMDFVDKQLGRIDVLVNNAGMSPLYPSLSEVSEELFDKVVSVNFKGPFRLSVLAAERMSAGDGGAIVNISTTSSLTAQSSELPYGCAKSALNTLTRGIARAYAPKVRCNGILPGPFDTDIATAWSPESRAAIQRQVPLGRIGKPDEIVGAALYLASDAASYTTGTLIRVDGGLTWAAP